MDDDQLEDGIWPPYEAFYLESMLFCTTSALRSVADLRAALQAGSATEANSPTWQMASEEILSSAQSIALQGAAISRYFWPVREREPHRSRARRLREGLKIRDDSPLRSRGLRNQMEHFDERLDIFVHGGVAGTILPAYVGPDAGEPEVPTHRFRAYYTDCGVLEILGNRYEMQPIVDEISEIHDRIAKCCEAGGRLPYPDSPSPSGGA